jgi:hypothetical protein
MSSDPMALRSGRKLSVIRLSGRYDDGEMNALGMAETKLPSNWLTP